MEEKIKRLKEHLRKVFPTLQGGKTGFWAVGEGEIWKAENPGEESAAVFETEIRNGIWLVTPVTISADTYKNVTFRFSTETAERLKVLAANDQRSQAGELEWLISERWKDIQVI